VVLSTSSNSAKTVAFKASLEKKPAPKGAGFFAFLCDGIGVAVKVKVNINDRKAARLADMPAIFRIRNQHYRRKLCLGTRLDPGCCVRS
jgi:hypothetical protein